MSIKAIDVIDLFPGELAARLEADEYFCDIPVIVFTKGDIRSEIENKQAALTLKTTKRGVAVVVLPVEADDNDPDLALGPLLLKVAFHVIEDVELNNDEHGTQKSAAKVARRLHQVIKTFSAPHLVTDLVADNPCITPFIPKDAANLTGRQVNFKCYEADTEVIHQAAQPAPVLSDDKKSFTLTCATPGAVIWYTLDESFPSPMRADPANANGPQVYTDAIAIPDAGCTVRAAAYFPGWLASTPLHAVITQD